MTARQLIVMNFFSNRYAIWRGGKDAVTADADLASHDRRFHPNGFDPRRDHCTLRDELEKSDKADELDKGESAEVGFSDEEMRRMEEMFGVTDDLDAAGWLLPNGSLLDFNRDYHKEGQQDWDEHGDIRKAFCDERQRRTGISDPKNRMKGLQDGIDAAMNAGGIRFANGPDGLYLDLKKEPTAKQYEQLEKIAEHEWDQDPYADGEGHVITFGDGKPLIYPDNETLAKRLVSDIKRHFGGEEESDDASAVRMFHASDEIPEGFSKEKEER